jgi:hypothetical protein
MRYCILFLWIFLLGCNNITTTRESAPAKPVAPRDSVFRQPTTGATPEPQDTAAQRLYANEAFKNVKVEKLKRNSYRATGKARIFEARFGWSVEQGHQQLAEGYESADAGAPSWGNFSFTVTVAKADATANLRLVLFESSAKDGSRLHELSLPLQ